MIDKHRKRTAKPQPPELPPHMLEDLTPAQKKAFGLSADGAPKAKRAAKKPSARKASKHAAKQASPEAPKKSAVKE